MQITVDLNSNEGEYVLIADGEQKFASLDELLKAVHDVTLANEPSNENTSS